MTFIASVVAKDGVAVIADSLVTHQSTILSMASYMEYIENRKIPDFQFQDLLPLFETKPSYTRDFEVKLMEYDKYTALATTGQAYINEKSIYSLISGIRKKLQKKGKQYRSDLFAKNLESLLNELKSEVISHVEKHGGILSTSFLVTHFNKTNSKTTIIQIDILPTGDKDSIKENIDKIVLKKEQPLNIACDGQNSICERILFGDIVSLGTILPHVQSILRKKLEDAGLTEGNGLPPGFYDELFDPSELLSNQELFKAAQIGSLSDLSLQQAVDLAWLLMKIEMDFQKYTKNIPTVGGIIKLAIIDDEGFRFIHGDTIRDSVA